MERYISLDVHAESSTCAVVGPTGKRLKMEVVETSGTALVEMIESIPGKRHLVFEEGTQSAWLCELLEPKVEELVVVSPVCSEGQKSDAKDAWALAEQLRTGAIERRVFKKPRASDRGELHSFRSRIATDKSNSAPPVGADRS